MSTEVVVAKLAGLTGSAAERRQLLTDRATGVSSEDGCLGYLVAERLDEPVSFVIVQTWASSETLRAHFGTDAHATYQHAVVELLATPSEVVIPEVASTTHASSSTSPTDPGRFG